MKVKCLHYFNKAQNFTMFYKVHEGTYNHTLPRPCKLMVALNDDDDIFEFKKKSIGF